MSRSGFSVAMLIAGGMLVAVVILSGFASVVTWQAALYATENNVESAEVVTANELPEECSRFAQLLAASQNVSIEEYHIGVGPIDVLLRYTPGSGWVAGDTNCSSRLSFPDNLHVGDQAYNIEGHYAKSTLHQKPLFRSGQLLGGLVGLGLIFIGYRTIRTSDTE